MVIYGQKLDKQEEEDGSKYRVHIDRVRFDLYAHSTMNELLWRMIMNRMAKNLVKFLSCAALSLMVWNTTIADVINDLNSFVEKSNQQLTKDLPGAFLFKHGFYVNQSFTRFDPGSSSNSGHTVIEECGGNFDSSDYEEQHPATARLITFQLGTS